jgi:hypothetical protein
MDRGNNGEREEKKKKKDEDEEEMELIHLLFIANNNFENARDIKELLVKLTEERVELPSNAIWKIKREDVQNHRVYFLVVIEKEVESLRVCITQIETVFRCFSCVKDVCIINNRLVLHIPYNINKNNNIITHTLNHNTLLINT